MTELDQLIAVAYEQEGAEHAVNKVYLKLLNSDFFIPINKKSESLAPDLPFMPLFAIEGEMYFMACFDTLDKFRVWAGDFYRDMDYAVMVGREVIQALGHNVYLALNPGTPYYKEFDPHEIQRLQNIVAKIMQWRNGAPAH